MISYVILFNFAEQGLKNVKDSVERAVPFKAALEMQKALSEAAKMIEQVLSS